MPSLIDSTQGVAPDKVASSKAILQQLLGIPKQKGNLLQLTGITPVNPLTAPGMNVSPTMDISPAHVPGSTPGNSLTHYSGKSLPDTRTAPLDTMSQLGQPGAIPNNAPAGMPSMFNVQDYAPQINALAGQSASVPQAAYEANQLRGNMAGAGEQQRLLEQQRPPDIQYNPLTAPSYPQRDQPAIPSRPAPQQEPISALLSLLGGIADPIGAGGYSAAANNASLQNSNLRYNDAKERFGMNTEQIDKAYNDAIAARREGLTLEEYNRQHALEVGGINFERTHAFNTLMNNLAGTTAAGQATLGGLQGDNGLIARDTAASKARAQLGATEKIAELGEKASGPQARYMIGMGNLANAQAKQGELTRHHEVTEGLGQQRVDAYGRRVDNQGNLIDAQVNNLNSLPGYRTGMLGVAQQNATSNATRANTGVGRLDLAKQNSLTGKAAKDYQAMYLNSEVARRNRDWQQVNTLMLQAQEKGLDASPLINEANRLAGEYQKADDALQARIALMNKPTPSAPGTGAGSTMGGQKGNKPPTKSGTTPDKISALKAAFRAALGK